MPFLASVELRTSDCSPARPSLASHPEPVGFGTGIAELTAETKF